MLKKLLEYIYSTFEKCIQYHDWKWTTISMSLETITRCLIVIISNVFNEALASKPISGEMENDKY